MGSLLDEYGAFIIDLDGVVYLLDDPIPGSALAINHLQEAGVPFVFLTNNSSSTAKQYVRKLQRFGLTVEQDRIVTSSQAVARYLDGKTEGRRAFVIGEEGLTSELKPLGMELVGAVAASRVDYVIVGWDREFDFNKLKAAVLAIRDGAHFIATNADATYPTPEGLWPGAGSIVAAVSTGSGQVPVVVGKPNPLIVQIALDRMASGPKGTLLIGDRLDTDILSGIAAGIDTLLVLTGVSTPEEVNETGIRPTHVRDSLSAMLNG